MSDSEEYWYKRSFTAYSISDLEKFADYMKERDPNVEEVFFEPWNDGFILHRRRYFHNWTISKPLVAWKREDIFRALGKHEVM